MKLPTYLFNIALCFLFLLSCEQSKVDNNDSDNSEINDSDVVQIDSESDDSESTVECSKDSDCGKNEVCDPYGDCLCNAGERLFFKYDGECISYFEANRLFCNGHAGMIDVNPEFLKGGCAFIEKGQENEVICTSCLLGYVGKFCEKKIDGYNDSGMELDEENNKVDFPFPEPYCKNDSDCVEGLKCIDGYCECEGEVIFEDEDMTYLVAAHLGLKDGRTVFSGKELLSIKDFQLVLYKESTDISNLRCLSNIRNIAIPGVEDGQDLTEVTYLKKVQHLAGVFSSKDISWIENMENLLSLNISIDGGWTSINFIESFLSRESVTKFELWVYCGVGFCENFDFSPIKNFENLDSLVVLVRGDKIPEIDFEIFSELKNLKEIYIRNYGGVAKNISKLNNLSSLISFGIDMEGYNLSDLNQNNEFISLVVSDSVVTAPVAELFPNLMYLTYIDLGTKNTAEIISGLNKIKNLKIDNNTIGLKYEGLENVISEMRNLRTLWISPFIGKSSMGFVKNNKYLERIQLLNAARDEKPRDISVVEDLLYLYIYEDMSGGSNTFAPFVENCKNGGTLCREDSDIYLSGLKNEDGVKFKKLFLSSPNLDVLEEMSNINYLRDAGVIVEYNE